MACRELQSILGVLLCCAGAVLSGCIALPSDDDSEASGTPSGEEQAGVISSGFTFPEDADPAMAALPFVEDELLVRSLPGAESEELRAAYAEVGASLIQDLAVIETAVLHVQPAELVKTAAALSTHPLLEAVQKSYLFAPEATPNDERFDSQGYLESMGLTEAWEVTTGSGDLVIAVLDSGVDPEHPDLAGKLVGGWNTYDDTGDTTAVHDHGTWVAGVAAAASNNGKGIAGVSWASPIMPVRVTDANGRASSRSIAAGLVWAVDHGATVINVSFAPLASDGTIARAARYVRNSGGLVFISAGNDGTASVASGTVNALFVGAVTATDQRASFSTTGAFVDLAAPGAGIETTHPDGGYRRVSGTSFASPIGAGVAALIWSARPELRPVTVEDVLLETAVDLGPVGPDDEFGEGRIDASAAIQMALDVAEPTDGPAPSVRILSPTDGEAVTGVINVRAEVFGDSPSDSPARSVVDAVLSVDGVPFATDTAAPFKFALNTARFEPGTHTLTCLTHNDSGNASEPESVQIVVGELGQGGGSRPDEIEPLVIINFPVSGTQVSSSVGIQATVTDNVGLRRVEWVVDGVPVEMSSVAGTRAVVSFIWHAEAASRGAHVVSIRATDAADNSAATSLTLLKG